MVTSFYHLSLGENNGNERICVSLNDFVTSILLKYDNLQTWTRLVPSREIIKYERHLESL